MASCTGQRKGNKTLLTVHYWEMFLMLSESARGKKFSETTMEHEKAVCPC